MDRLPTNSCELSMSAATAMKSAATESIAGESTAEAAIEPATIIMSTPIVAVIPTAVVGIRVAIAVWVIIRIVYVGISLSASFWGANKHHDSR